MGAWAPSGPLPRASFDEATLTGQLEAAGFAVTAVHGDWSRGPLTDTSRVIVVVARAR